MTAWTPKPTTVLGWRSPWSGDDNDPRPWTYQVWVRAHWADMRLRHRLGFHAWRPFPLACDGQRCDWCGALGDDQAFRRAGPVNEERDESTALICSICPWVGDGLRRPAVTIINGHAVCWEHHRAAHLASDHRHAVVLGGGKL